MNIGSDNFEKTEEEVIKKTKETFKMFYPIYWSGLKTLKTAVKLLIEENTVSENRYVTALLLLINRSIQHLESMRLLTERGLYGDAFVLSRSLMSNVAMAQYLKYKPELVEDFLKESRDDYQDKKSGFSTKFSEAAIHKVLTDNGVQPFSNSFQVLSKTAHASAFGAQLYGSRGSKDQQYHFKYGPGYETEKALAIISIISAGHYDLLDNILVYRCQQDSNPEWLEVLTEERQLRIRVDIFSTAAITTVEQFKKMRGY